MCFRFVLVRTPMRQRRSWRGETGSYADDERDKAGDRAARHVLKLRPRVQGRNPRLLLFSNFEHAQNRMSVHILEREVHAVRRRINRDGMRSRRPILAERA